MHIFDPQDCKAEPASNPHRFELVGPLNGIDFPKTCPSCGAAADASISIQKVFFRDPKISHINSSGHTRRYWIESATVPFCDACVRTHEQEVGRMSALQYFGSTLASEMFIPLVGMSLFGVGLLWDAATGGGRVPLVLATICLVIAGACYRVSVGETKRSRVPAQTSITRSFDFSPNVSDFFDKPRYLYSIKDAHFAEQFRALNHGREWDSTGPVAQRASHRRKVLMWISAIVVLGAYIASLLDRYRARR